MFPRVILRESFVNPLLYIHTLFLAEFDVVQETTFAAHERIIHNQAYLIIYHYFRSSAFIL